MAAHALVALLPDEQKITTAIRLAEATHASSNAAHGAWLAVLHLLQNHRASVGFHNMNFISPIFAAATRCAGDASVHPLVREICSEVLSGDVGYSRDHALLAPVLRASEQVMTPESARKVKSVPHLEAALIPLASKAGDHPAISHQVLQVMYASSDEAEVSFVTFEFFSYAADINDFPAA